MSVESCVSVCLSVESLMLIVTVDAKKILKSKKPKFEKYTFSNWILTQNLMVFLITQVGIQGMLKHVN